MENHKTNDQKSRGKMEEKQIPTPNLTGRQVFYGTLKNIRQDTQENI